MLVIGGPIRLDAARREEAIAAAKEVMEATRKEPGCISYTFSADLEDPGCFMIFEEWETQEALEAHFATPHMASFSAKFGALGLKGMNVQKYEVSSVGPVR